MDKMGTVTQTEDWDDVRHMFDEHTEFVGLEEEITEEDAQ